jgi:TIR domain-containing protein
MADIFISFAHEDEARVQHLVRALEELGWSVFWDRHIPAGKTWRSYIGQALNEANCVMVAWSRHSIDSQWVMEEADEGQKRGVLVPVLLDAVEPPIGFRSIQAGNLVEWAPGRPSPRFEQLIQDIKVVLGSRAATPQAGPLAESATLGNEVVHAFPRKEPRIRARHFAYYLIAAIVTVMALAGAGYWTYQKRYSDSGYLTGSYTPRVEIASGTTVMGLAKKLQLFEESEKNPEILTVSRVLEQFLGKSAEKSKEFDSKVFAYESRPFEHDTVDFTARSATFLGKQRTGMQHSAFLVRNGKPEVIRLDIFENGAFVLNVPAANAGGYVMLLVWVWAEKGALKAINEIKFEVE